MGSNAIAKACTPTIPLTKLSLVLSANLSSQTRELQVTISPPMKYHTKRRTLL